MLANKMRKVAHSAVTIKYNRQLFSVSLTSTILHRDTSAATTQEAMTQYTNFVFFSVLQILTLKVA